MRVLRKLKFWDKTPEEKPKVPQDIQDFQASRPLSGHHRGYVKDSALTKGVAVVAAIGFLAVIGIFVYLYFYVFLFHT